MAKKQPIKAVKFAEWESGPFGGGRYIDPNAPKRVVDDRPFPQIVKEFVRDNPASIATGLAAGLTLPASLPGMLGAGALMTGARAIDKNNMFSDKPSDYEAKESVENFQDLLFTGLFSGIGQGIFGRTPKGKIAPKAEPTIRVGADRTPVLMDAPVEAGFPPGYKIHNYEAYPIAREIDAQLIEQGIPRFVTPPEHSGLSKYLVGNPERNKIPHLPEGKAYAEALATRDPIIPRDQIIYSGLRRLDGVDVNPELAYDPKNPAIKWGSDNMGVANTYVQPGAFPYQYRDLIMKKIKAGIINDKNLPPGFTSVEEIVETIMDPAQYHTSIGRSILRDAPEMNGTLQEFIPFPAKVKQIDKKGDHWLGKDILKEAERLGIKEELQIHEMAHELQRQQLKTASSEGYDALQYLNQIDQGPYPRAYQAGEIRKPSTVHVALDPRQLKSIYNLGTWNLKDPRILGGLVGGLGLHAAKTDNARGKQ